MEAHSVQPQYPPICSMHLTSPASSFGSSETKENAIYHVNTWIHGGIDVEGTSGRCKQESHQTMSVSSVCVSCLRQTYFQADLGRSCSTTQATDKGIPSEWRLGSQPLPDGAERPICPTCLAFTRPSVAPAVANGSLGAARSASRSGNPIRGLRCGRFASHNLVALSHDSGWTPDRTLVATLPPFRMGLPEREALRAGALPPPAHRFGALRLLNSGWSVRGRTSRLAAPLSSVGGAGAPRSIRRLRQDARLRHLFALPHAPFMRARRWRLQKWRGSHRAFDWMTRYAPV